MLVILRAGNVKLSIHSCFDYFLKYCIDVGSLPLVDS